jgi:hypothetical protein
MCGRARVRPSAERMCGRARVRPSAERMCGRVQSACATSRQRKGRAQQRIFCARSRHSLRSLSRAPPRRPQGNLQACPLSPQMSTSFILASVMASPTPPAYPPPPSTHLPSFERIAHEEPVAGHAQPGGARLPRRQRRGAIRCQGTRGALEEGGRGCAHHGRGQHGGGEDERSSVGSETSTRAKRARERSEHKRRGRAEQRGKRGERYGC